jgi:hypothetical protein
MKFSDWLTDFFNALNSQKTAMERLEEALSNVKSANSNLYSSLGQLGDIDLSDWLGEGIDMKKNNVTDYVDLDSIANANPVTEIMNEVSGMANLFGFDLSKVKIKW